MDFRNSLSSTGSVGAGAAALVGSLSRLKGTSDDPEERKREMEAKQTADNLGAAIGLVLAAAAALKEQKAAAIEDQQQTM